MARIIALIEDDATLLGTYKDVLSAEGYEVTTAKNGIDGLKLVREQKPDIVLLDLLMPGLGGLTFLKEFDAKNHPETKIIVFSNLSDPEEMQQALELGAVRYIIKANLTLGELLEILKSL